MNSSYIKRVEIVPIIPRVHGNFSEVLKKETGSDSICHMMSAFLLESNSELSDDVLNDVLIDKTKEYLLSTHDILWNEYSYVAEIGFLPGVTDNVSKTCQEAFSLSNLKVTSYSRKLIAIKSELKDVEKIAKLAKLHLYNPLIESFHLYKSIDLEKDQRFSTIEVPKVQIEHSAGYETIDLSLSDDELLKLSVDRCLALTIPELRLIEGHYKDENIKSQRILKNLPEIATDVELEVLAQTWSEHCKHKIFAAKIDYKNEITGETISVDSLYKSYIKKATKTIGSDFLISVFSDNAGIVRFDKNIDVCIKAETHNSPSALDPYGGALTGILGVNRDILGCGLGSKPIANTNVFCVGKMGLENRIGKDKMPATLMAPEMILKGIHAGVRDGGNKSGIPTVNGAMFFDDGYAGKPLVFCGTVGVMPQKLKDGRPGSEKGAVVGDLVYVGGGAVGADGIHGATFSSLDLNEDSPATAVQIGDPITQKRLMDFLLEARDLGLYTCVTDNGAGGISSSIGEMATLTGGAKIDLATHTVKYPGLSPWEIMISESQERMTFAVASKHSEEFEALADKRGVDVFCMGEFTKGPDLEIFYKDELVGSLNMHFLHEGLPQMNLTAIKKETTPEYVWHDDNKKDLPKNPFALLPLLLNQENVASKRPWVEQYDQEVQGATRLKPFVGREQRSPGNSGVIALEAHGGVKDSSLVIGCGLAPRMSEYDGRLMAQLSVDEAMRNIIANGADPDKICLLDNFCWPDPIASTKTPDGAEKLATLVETCVGLYDICTLYKAPLVSGKDSMKNDFRGKNKAGEALNISIKPTLLVTAMGYGNIKHCVDSTLKVESELYVVGKKQISLMATELGSYYHLNQTLKVPSFDFSSCYETYKTIYQLMKEGLISSCHDIAEGGLLVALAEKTFDAQLNVSVKIDDSTDLLKELYGEGPGRFIVSVTSNEKEDFLKVLNDNGVDFSLLGDAKLAKIGSLEVNSGSHKVNFLTNDLLSSWEREWEL